MEAKMVVRPTQKAYEYLKSRILDGTLRPAQHLTEVQLSEEIGVSRNTVKKVLLLLAEEKLVLLENNKGATVMSLSVDEIVQYYEIRMRLEEIAVASAAVNISDDQISELRAVLKKMIEFKEQKNFVEYSRHNQLFHSIIYDASEKRIAVNMIREIKAQLARYQLRTIMVPGRSDVSVVEHQQILDALALHDIDAAVKAIRVHVGHVLETIYEFKSLFN